MSLNTAFTRLCLQQVMREIKLLTTPEERKLVWVYHFSRNHWEFHQAPALNDQGLFYWHGNADNAYDARYQGWSAWLYKLQGDPTALNARLGPNKERYLWLQRGHALWAWDMEQARREKLARGSVSLTAALSQPRMPPRRVEPTEPSFGDWHTAPPDALFRATAAHPDDCEGCDLCGGGEVH